MILLQFWQEPVLAKMLECTLAHSSALEHTVNKRAARALDPSCACTPAHCTCMFECTHTSAAHLMDHVYAWSSFACARGQSLQVATANQKQLRKTKFAISFLFIFVCILFLFLHYLLFVFHPFFLWIYIYFLVSLFEHLFGVYLVGDPWP